MRTYNGIGQSILRKCKSGILLNVLLFLGKYVFFWHFKIYVWTLFSEIFSLSWDCRDMRVRYCIFIFSVVLKGSPQNKRCLLKVSKSEMQISKPSSLRVKWDFFWIKSIAWKGLDSNWTSERVWPHCSLVQFDNGQIYQSRQIVLFHPSTCGGSMQQLMYLRAIHNTPVIIYCMKLWVIYMKLLETCGKNYKCSTSSILETVQDFLWDLGMIWYASNGNHYSNAGHKTILGPMNFALPKNLCTYQDIPFFKHPIGGGQLPKNVCKIL